MFGPTNLFEYLDMYYSQRYCEELLSKLETDNEFDLSQVSDGMIAELAKDMERENQKDCLRLAIENKENGIVTMY